MRNSSFTGSVDLPWILREFVRSNAPLTSMSMVWVPPVPAGEHRATPLDKVHVWPHLLVVEFVAALVITAFTLIFSIFDFDRTAKITLDASHDPTAALKAHLAPAQIAQLAWETRETSPELSSMLSRGLSG